MQNLKDKADLSDEYIDSYIHGQKNYKFETYAQDYNIILIYKCLYKHAKEYQNNT
jgi:hypothetical protein